MIYSNHQIKELTMKSKIILSLLVTAIYHSSAFAVTDKMQSESMASNPAAMQSAQAGHQQDNDVLVALMALNENEINAAKLATKKAHASAVKKYAHYLYQEHSKNLKAEMMVSKRLKLTPMDSADATSLKSQGQSELSSLQALDGKAFDKAYIEAMIKDHQAALQLIDDKLVKEAMDPALKKHVMMARMHIEKHLKKAQMIDKKLAAAN